MRQTTCLLAIVALSAAGRPAFAQTAPTPTPTAPLSRCGQLTGDWRSIEIDLAKINVDGLADNSAPRATMRASQETALFTKAGVLLRLMELNKCPIPARAPSDVTYMLETLQCRTATLKASIEQIRQGVPECDRSKWPTRP